MRKLPIHILAAVLLVFLPCPLSSAGDTQSLKKVFKNGLTVLVTEMPSSPVVSVYALVKTGAASEGKFLGTGISHFLEHMLFKGTHGRSVGQLAARIQAVGGEINAATGMDYTIYTITVPHDSFDVALSILSDMLMNATMVEEDVERERKVIFGEMRMRQDSPDRKLSEIVFQNVYLRHPYRHPIIGYESLLAGVTREDLVEYYQKNYTPNNTIISVSGNIDIDTVLPKIKNTFKDFKRSRPVVRNLPQEPFQITGRRYEEEYATSLTRLSMSFSGVSLLHPDLYALDVLAGILGQGRSSRLYLDVYEKKGLVHNISASNYTPIDQGIFGITCLLEQGNIEKVIESVLEEIDAIKRNGVKKEELAKVKTQVRSEHVLRHQTAASVTYAQAIDEAFAGDYRFSKKYIDAIDQVTNDAIKRVANQYLIESGLTTVILKPKQKRSGEQPESREVLESKIQKYVLDNGLTVLLKEDDTFPVVSIRLSAAGGVRQEEIALGGLSSMMASTWIKGTKRRSANQIAEETESLGIRLGSFSGRNSFGLSLEFLAEHLPVALDLLKELTLDPTFPEEEIVKIRKNMQAAIRQRDDNIFSTSGLALKETLFLTHPYRLDQRGTLESVAAITRDDLVDFYDRFAVAHNMVLSVFGDIDAGEVLDDIENIFGNLKDQEITLKSHHEDPPRQTREKMVTMDKEQAMVMFGFQGAQLSDDDQYGLEVITTLLGSPFSGRIFTNIRDQLGEAYTLGGQYIPGPDMGVIYFYVQTTEEEVRNVRELLKKEIVTLHSEYVSEQELTDTKAYLKGAFAASQETSLSLSFMVSLDELYGLGFDHYQRYDDRIDRVTKEDIQRLARQYLDLNKMAVVITKPAQ